MDMDVLYVETSPPHANGFEHLAHIKLAPYQPIYLK